jgi:Na+/melibiose symporter-like transporter
MGRGLFIYKGENMNSQFLLSALAIISVLTTLTVEGIKKILDEKHKEYSSNLLAVIVAAVITFVGSVGYVLYNGIPWTIQTVIIMVALIFLSFLSSTVSYDKVKQLLEQLG